MEVRRTTTFVPMTGLSRRGPKKKIDGDFLLSGEFAMMKRLMMVGMIAATFGLLAAKPVYAGITTSCRTL